MMGCQKDTRLPITAVEEEEEEIEVVKELVTIKDPALQQYLKDEGYALTDGKIEKQKLEEVYTLDLSTGDYRSFETYDELALFKNLKTLSLPDNGSITQLDLSANSLLESLLIFRFTQSKATILKEINTSSLPKLRALKLVYGKSPEPPIFEGQMSQIVKLDLSKNPDLEELSLKGLNMEELDLSLNTGLKVLWMKEMLKLDELHLKNNVDIKSVYLTNLPAMKYFCINEKVNKTVANTWTLDTPVKYTVCE
ncbi:MAG: hypothetical protein LRY55_04000 [Leadbetterella sp.]|nr:hypothetical protein [Leadbetterella sp.]